MPNLPKLVVNSNLYTALFPVTAHGVVMHNFCVPASKAKMQAWLDQLFAEPTGGEVRYEALGDRLFFAIAEIAELRAVGPEGAKGYTSEIDTALWIMARKVGGKPTDLRFIPSWLFVDSGEALASGREVWGFPKQIGKFDFGPQTSELGAARDFTVSAQVVETFGHDAKAQLAPIFEARPRQKSERKHGILGSLEAFAEHMAQRVVGELANIAAHVNTVLAGGNVTMAFLKQFPHAPDPHLACYQGVVESEASVLKMRRSGITQDQYDVRITSYDSHPFAEALGVESGWQDAGEASWVEFDFEQKLGQQIWVAPA